MPWSKWILFHLVSEAYRALRKRLTFEILFCASALMSNTAGQFCVVCVEQKDHKIASTDFCRGSWRQGCHQLNSPVNFPAFLWPFLVSPFVWFITIFAIPSLPFFSYIIFRYTPWLPFSTGQSWRRLSENSHQKKTNLKLVQETPATGKPILEFSQISPVP